MLQCLHAVTLCITLKANFVGTVEKTVKNVKTPNPNFHTKEVKPKAQFTHHSKAWLNEKIAWVALIFYFLI
jgi:hypothetical protein